MNGPSAQQADVINEGLSALSVIACAGSGKTLTAVRRVDSVRSQIEIGRSHVALLSFSNVAVDVFGRSYIEEAAVKDRAGRSRVCIETFDGFITTNILRPHACRTMKCTCMPYLVTGNENYLSNKNFQFWPKETPKFPQEIGKIELEYKSGIVDVYARFHNSTIPIENGIATVQRLGEIGAYTHSLGRYWAFEVLRREPKILAALARRYRQIIVDEAQDIGSIHNAILDLLAGAGSQITLIGDPNQAIFEFCGADGGYLKTYVSRTGVKPKELTINYRSVPGIVAAANSLSKRTDTAYRKVPAEENGAFFIPFAKVDENKLIQAFQSAVSAAGLNFGRSAIVCRALKKKQELRSYGPEFGQGTTKLFAAAVMARDAAADYQEAFRLTVRALVALLKTPPPYLCARILDISRYPEFREFRRVVWEFTRNSGTGLPAGTLKAESEWHPKLVQRVKALLGQIQGTFKYPPLDKLGFLLKKTKLPDVPMVDSQSKKSVIDPILRVETIHGVKGESLDAVLYLADKDHVKAMLDGTGTELGRIGYVALTRACNLFWLGLLADDAVTHRNALLQHSFVEKDYTKSGSALAPVKTKGSQTP
jgi:UvrD-like helicase family protein